MALKPQLSFSSGELDPILHDRVTLERFQNGLHTARNTMIGKSGTIKSRFGKFHFAKAKFDNTNLRIYSPPNSNVLFEFGIDYGTGASYGRLYDHAGNILVTDLFAISAIEFTEANLKQLHFVTSGEKIYVFKCKERTTTRKLMFTARFVAPYDVILDNILFTIPAAPLSLAGTLTATGYNIDYAFTSVIKGEESLALISLNSSTTAKKPIAVGENNILIVTLFTSATPALVTAYLATVNELRIYQRPTEGSAFGFLGRTTNIYIDGTSVKAKFTDIGANADFSNGMQTPVGNESSLGINNPGLYGINTGAVYQQRLLLGNFLDYNKESILSSRPGFQYNFYRDFPYSANSALNFKAGTSGNAEVLRMIESDGLVVFTTAGVFASVGILSPDNISLQKRGNWVIDEDIPPLVIPGGLFFVDKTTSTVRQLVYSQELGGYDSVDQSIFSDHLFKVKTIKSWCFQQGTLPLIIVTFSDGTFATFTYSFEHQMKAWTRHNSVYPVEQVEGTSVADLSFFVTNKNGIRYIEGTVPRSIPSSVYAANPEANLLAYCAFMDALKIKVDLRNDSLVGADVFLLTPVTPGVWTGSLTLTCGTSALFPNTADLGAVGSIFRFFHPITKNKIDLTVTSRNSTSSVVVTPSEEFPSTYASGFRMYLTHLVVTGLNHLEGETVSIISDGDVVSSPYNNNANDTFSVLSVASNQVTLPERSAITIVGRPIPADIKTLNVSTVEQSPTTLESLTVNKLYVRVHESRGLFVDNIFPEEKINEVDGTSVADMQSLDEYYVPSVTPIIGNRSKPLMSKRIEVTIPGSWDSNGQISIRQVDPLHFEILSIMADVEILRRSDR